MDCPLCGADKSLEVVEGPDNRIYRLCGICRLIFIDPVFRPRFQKEKERYLTHNNGIEYPGYVDFLKRAMKPALQFIRKGDYGLDYGCGPNPTLSILLSREGIDCDDYDPIFYQNGIRRDCYDFIFATECFEHFFNPGNELTYLLSLMKKGSSMIVMTKLYRSLSEFETWHYVNDETHVVFYHTETMNYIARRWNFTIVLLQDDRVVIFRKN